MIVATVKPLTELLNLIISFKKVLVFGCDSCVTIGRVGGEASIRATLTALELGLAQQGKTVSFSFAKSIRQCEPELVELTGVLTDGSRRYDAILCFGCSVGAQTLSHTAHNIPVIPALNTRFMGAPLATGVWENRCIGCGDCFIHLTGGICVLSRCPRSSQNGSCGYETTDGHCDINPEEQCIWTLIRSRYNSKSTLKTDSRKLTETRDWSISSSGGVTKIDDSNYHEGHSEE